MISLRKRMTGPRSSRMLIPALLFFICASLSAIIARADEVRRVEGLVFSEVLVLGPVAVEIRQDAVIELQVRGLKENLDGEPFYLSGDTIVLGKAGGRGDKSASELRFRIAMPVLHDLELRGSGDVYVKDFVMDGASQAATVRITVDGSGEIRLFNLRARELDIGVEGSGGIKAAALHVNGLNAVVAGSGDLFIQTLQAQKGEFVIAGSGSIAVTEASQVRSLELNVIGSGDADLAAVDADVAEVNVLGAGDAAIGLVAAKLNANVLGSGDVLYGGEPQLERVELGSGEIRQRD